MGSDYSGIVTKHHSLLAYCFKGIVRMNQAIDRLYG